jgi:hypothetical protein
VLVADELEPVAAALREALHLGEPFEDPGVAEFGIRNAVFALGDCFLEVIAPTRPGTAAGRYLDRRGAGGYMALFDLEDLESARERACQVGVRVVWQIDLPDISGTHLHPADMRGAIISLDESRPYGSWRWGGPDWTGKTGERAAGRLSGITVAVADPTATAERWGEVLGVATQQEECPLLHLDGAWISFRGASQPGEEGITEIAVALPAHLRCDRAAVDVGGVRLSLLEGG